MGETNSEPRPEHGGYSRPIGNPAHMTTGQVGAHRNLRACRIAALITSVPSSNDPKLLGYSNNTAAPARNSVDRCHQPKGEAVSRH